MKRFSIIALSLGLIVAMVFGFTFITEFTPNDPADKYATIPDEKKPVGQAFNFPSSVCKYDPAPDATLQNRMFRGFYEVGETDSALFWFANRSPRPVFVTSLGASCTTCSAARIAHVAPELIEEYSRGMAVAGVVNSLLPGGPDLFAAFSALRFESKIPWQKIVLDMSRQQLIIPPGLTGEKPGLGVVQLQLTASHTGSRTPEVAFRAGVENEPGTSYSFQLNFQVVPSFAAKPKAQDVGEIAIGVAPRPFDLVTWSATREFGERFPPPAVRTGDDDPFVTIGPAVKLTGEEMEKLNAMVSYESKIPNRVLAGYRYPISMLREVHGREADIGPFSKEIFVAGPNTDRTSLMVTGTVTGIVRLAEGKEVDFGSYEAKYERTKKVTFISEKPDLDFAIVEGETKPRFLSATLDPPTKDGGVRVWKMNLKVAANQGFQANWQGVVILKSSGPNPITIRVPIKGSGTRR